MGKKGAEGTPAEATTESEIEALKMKLQKMEELMQEQSKDLKAEVVSSQLSMKQDMKEQMDEFLSLLWKVQTSTPPPQPMSVE
jgi:hypothetical protein